MNPAERAQSAPLGVALLLGITILGTTAVVALGGAALTDAQGSSNLARAEQSLTQFDSQAAQVALGDAAVRTTNFGRVDGGFRVNPVSEPDSGTITITHVNYTGSNDHVLYTGDLGSVVYENGGTEIAYQGGGVWLREEGGSARMISPPEFHYRQGTLTFPVIQTTGSAAVSGSPDATVSRAADTVRKFSDSNSSYPNNDTYQNPIEDGYVTVTVESEYYEGWAEYFRTRTDGTVTVDDANQRVTLDLSTLGATGSFGIPSDSANGGGAQEVQGLGDGHALTDYTFRIFPKDDQESEFSNLRWSMYVDEGNKKFEIALKASGTSGCGDTVGLAIYYSDDAHSSYEGWTGSENVSCDDIDSDPTDEYFIDVELVDDSVSPAGPNLTYSSLSGSQLAHYKNDVSGASFQDPGTLPGHSSGTAHTSDRNYTSGDPETRDFVGAHYFAELGPNFELKVEDQQNGNAAGVGESSSQGYIDYGGGGQVVTFLHVTENRIEVDLN
ncbi:hypothetical protein BRD04_10895 [Halobacteriales archaeon QS_9_67_17]|nr:MAG: hypothetical protein BRD04_10895 [Halobacteriales archaeon QS_9_67_17]